MDDDKKHKRHHHHHHHGSHDEHDGSHEKHHKDHDKKKGSKDETKPSNEEEKKHHKHHDHDHDHDHGKHRKKPSNDLAPILYDVYQTDEEEEEEKEEVVPEVKPKPHHHREKPEEMPESKPRKSILRKPSNFKQKKSEDKTNAPFIEPKREHQKKHEHDAKLLKDKHQKRPHLEQVLKLLKKFEEPHETGELLPVLKKFGLPGQNALLDYNWKSDAKSFHFGNFIKLMFSPVLRNYTPANTANSYLPISRVSPAVTAIRYKGVQMRPDEFLKSENMKASKKHRELDEVREVVEDEAHFKFLKDLAIQQKASLPLTVMFDVLNEQIKDVEKICDTYAKHLGRSNQNTKVAEAHLQLMEKHLQALEFLGLRPFPPLSVIHKFERQPEQENPYVTPSSSSTDVDEEIDEFLQGDTEKTMEEVREMEEMDEDNQMLQEKELND